MQPSHVLLAVSDSVVSMLAQRFFESGAEPVELFRFGENRLALSLTKAPSIAALADPSSAQLEVELLGIVPFASRAGARLRAWPLKLRARLLARIDDQRCTLAVRVLRLGVDGGPERPAATRASACAAGLLSRCTELADALLAKAQPRVERMLNLWLSSGWPLQQVDFVPLVAGGPTLSSNAGYLIASAALAEPMPPSAELPRAAFDAPAALFIDGAALQKLLAPFLFEQLQKHTPLAAEASLSLPAIALAPAIAAFGTMLPVLGVFQQAVQQLVPSLWYRATLALEQPVLSVAQGRGVLIDLVVCIGPLDLAVEVAHQRFPFGIGQLVRTQVQVELVLEEGVLSVEFKSAAVFSELNALLDPWLSECRRIPGLGDIAEIARRALNDSLTERIAELLPRFQIEPLQLPLHPSLTLSIAELRATVLADRAGAPFLKITGRPVLV